MMPKQLLIIALSIGSNFSFAQPKTEEFKITLPENKVANSLYNSIHLLDIRNDTTDFGIVQKGAFNKRVKVVAETSLAIQFNNLLNAMIHNRIENGELLLLLRQLSFAEVTGALSETGYFQFRAVLFAHKNGEYKKLQTIDTVVVVSSMDVTKKMFRLGSKTITDFLAANLAKEPIADFWLTKEQVPQIDSIEKSRLPLYTATSYTEGLYRSFTSFLNQVPDEKTVSVDFDKKGRVVSVSYLNKKGKPQEIEKRWFYAFVYNGKPFVAGEFGCYPLEKKANDFYFIGKANDAKSGDVATATVFFGIIGGLIASSATSKFEMKIDHLSGGFMRVKEIEK